MLLSALVVWLSGGSFLDNIPFYMMVLFFDAVHVYSTFTYVYTSPLAWKRHRTWLISIPIILLVLNVLLMTYDTTYFWIFFSTWSIYHFLKQSQAWFYVSAGMGVSRDPLTIKLDKLAILAATFGFAFCSLCAPDSKGWFGTSDLLQLPNFFYIPLITLTSVFIAIYPLRHLYRFLRGEKQNWAAHHIFALTAVLWWGTRLGNLDQFAFATVVCHAVPYLYLGLRFVSYKFEKVEKFYLYPKLKLAAVLIPMLILAMFGASLEVIGRYSNEVRLYSQDLYLVLAVLFNTISLTHYTFDMFTWNRHHNPEWVAALGEKSLQVEVLKKAVVNEAA